MTYHDNIALILKPVSCLQSETRGDRENSMLAIGNVKASEEILGHVDLHPNTSKTLKAGVAEVGDVSTRKDDNVGTPLSGSTSKEFLELSYWLPQNLCNVYAKKGITKLYPWQVIFALHFSYYGYNYFNFFCAF